MNRVVCVQDKFCPHCAIILVPWLSLILVRSQVRDFSPHVIGKLPSQILCLLSAAPRVGMCRQGKEEGGRWGGKGQEGTRDERKGPPENGLTVSQAGSCLRCQGGGHLRALLGACTAQRRGSFVGRPKDSRDKLSPSAQCPRQTGLC